MIRDDPRLGLFWFDDEVSELTVSAWAVGAGPPVVVGRMRCCSSAALQGPTVESAEQAWQIAEALGGVPVDRYGFLVTRARDLLP